MAVLWNLVNANNFDPLGSFQKGADLAKKQQIDMARRNTLAQLAQSGGAPDYQNAVTALAAAGDLQGAQAIGSIYGQQDDRNFRHDTSARDFAFREEQARRAQGNADRAFGLQSAQFGFQQQQANKPQIVQVEDPATGIKRPYAFNPLTRQFTPLGGEGSPVGAAQPDGASAAAINIPPPPPGVDVREWRKQAAKNAFSQIKGRDQQQTTANIVTQDIDRALSLVNRSPWTTTGIGATGIPYIYSGAANIPGTDAHDVAKLLDTIKANASFDRLQAMRNASPTGGALGQVSDNENKLLQATIGSLEQSQTHDQFVRNLHRVREVYDQIINGPKSAGASASGQQADPLGIR